MTPSERQTAVIIVSYNTADLLRSCLTSLHDAGGGAALEVIVIDNASSDGSAAMVRAEFPRIRLIVNSQNVGFGIANNQGVAAASGEFVLLLNSDTVVSTGAIDRMKAYLQLHERVALVGPCLVGGDGRRQRSARRFPTPLLLLLEQLNLAQLLPPTFRSQGRAGYPVDWLLGACLLGRRATLAEVGPFDPRFFMYGEDIDLCLRLRAAGGEIHHLPGVTITHLGGMSSRRSYLPMALRSVESMYLFYRKHYAPRALLVALLIFRAAAAARWARDALTLAYLTVLRGRRERRAALRRDLQLWSRILRLRPPPLSAHPWSE